MRPALHGQALPEAPYDAGARETSPTGAPASPKSVLRLLSRIRLVDTILLQGSPLLGAVASIKTLTPQIGIDLFLLALGSTCLVAHVFLLNDWLGMNGDLRDPNRAVAIHRSESGAVVGIGGLCVLLLAMSLVLLGYLGYGTLLIAIAIAASSALYSGPAVHGKGIPIFSSVLHLLGGSLHFLLGYSLFGIIDRRGMEIACFFGLTFAAGHLTQETRDYDADLCNGVRTNAVTFGKRRNFAAGLVLFSIADALLSILALRGTVPRILSLTAALYPLHVYWSLRALRDGLSFESIRRFKMRYRARYAVVGLAMTLAFLVQRTFGGA